MVEKYQTIIDKIKAETDTVLLFHSGAGKDSIVLCDILSRNFKRIVCCYMYMVKDLTHITSKINWALRKYNNIEFIQMPHFAQSFYRKYGDLKLEKNEAQKQLNLEDCIELARQKTGIEWVCLGFKKSDGLNRRVMLNTYEDSGIYRKGHKFFPLSEYNNKWCLRYIDKQKLIKPTDYDIKRGQSSDFVPTNIGCLLWCKEHYPADYKKILTEYPIAERYIFEYERFTKSSQADSQAVAN